MEVLMKRILTVLSLLMLICNGAFPAAADTLWYNGDFSGIGNLDNGINTVIGNSLVYDDFMVTGGGWVVTSVWSNNLMSYSTTQASWEIRSGMSDGNGGTLVASGTGPATQTLTGRQYSVPEYTIQVSGLNVSLAPGTYWLNVSPIASGSGGSYNSMTSGANAIGQPAGNDGNSLWTSVHYGYPGYTARYGGYDFSMGVGGTAVPLPGSVWFLGSGLMGLGAWRRFRKD
jgi:hypothetical protein